MARTKAGTFGLLQLAQEVIAVNRNKPLTAQEIWDLATDEQKEKLKTTANDPVQNIYSMIYQDIKKHDDSVFIGVGRYPTKWQLIESNEDESNEDDSDNDTNNNNDAEDIDDSVDSDGKSAPFGERDLHPLLVSYVGCDPYFSACYCKTIYHEKSSRKPKGLNHWIHPDIVGVSYPFGRTGSYNDQTLKFMSRLEHTECRLYSFEVKIKISASELRKWFFEAVSNSSWAHEGYLVALHYENDIEGEMKMLNESFGIGFIKLNAEDYTKSVRLFTAKRKDALDWNMVNRLADENPDFQRFIATIQSDMSSSSVRNINDFDKQFDSGSDQAFLDHIRNHHII